MVPTLSLCVLPVWIAVTTQSGLVERDPHSSNFWSCSECFKCGGQNCNDDKDDVFVPLMVGTTFCLDRAVHAPHGADACSTNSSSVDTFHVDSWNSRDNVEQRVQRRFWRNRVDMVQLGSLVTSPEDRDTAVRLRGYKTRHAQQHRLATVLDRARWRAKLQEFWRPTTLALVVQNKKSQSLLAYGLGSGPASSWWKSVSDVSMELERIDNLANSGMVVVGWLGKGTTTLHCTHHVWTCEPTRPSRA